MKGGIHDFKGRQVSLIIIALAFTVVLLWAWEDSWLQNAIPLPQDEWSQLSSGGQEISISEPEMNNGTTEIHTSVVTEGAEEHSSDHKLQSGVVTEGAEKHSSDHKLQSGVVIEGAEEHSSDHKLQSGVVIEGAEEHSSDHKLQQEQSCDYAKGKWVLDNNRPLYSGFGCKQWLSGSWACHLTKRPDFTYEKLRWQPKYCKMEEFEGSKFLKRMQDKTLAFVGDSLGRQQFQSMMCMITGGKDDPSVEDVGKKYGLVKPRHAKRPDGWAYRFPSTNTTVLYYWSATLCDLEPLNVAKPDTEVAMHLDRPPQFLRRYLDKFNVLVLNTGHHWNRGKLKANRWVMYVGGKPSNDMQRKPIFVAKEFTVYSIIKWVNLQLPSYPGLKAFYRTISPRHFVRGDWNTGGSCNNTNPMHVGEELMEEISRDRGAATSVNGTAVKLLDITALSDLRDEGHISRFTITGSAGVQDCLHWCLPGVPDTWNEILFAQM